MTINVIEAIGWIGSTLFALCGLPQAASSWKHKHSDGLTWLFLMMWLGGELLTIIYVSATSRSMPLLVNYYLNALFLAVIIWFKTFPRRTST